MRTGNPMSKKYWLAVPTLIAVIVWYFTSTSDPLNITVVTASTGTVEMTVSNTRAGTIKACRRSGLSMPSGGRVDALHVKEGDHVKAGDLLLELWNKDREAMTAQAESQLKAARHHQQQLCVEAENMQREADRVAKLLTQKLASKEQAETTNTQAQASAFACQASIDGVTTAEAQLQMNQALLAETKLRAPFDGVIAEINGEVGEYVTPSPPGVATPPAVDLIDYTCLYVTAPIDEVDAGKLALQQPVRISLDAFRGKYFSGTLNRIAPYVLEIEKQARTVEVDVLFDREEDRQQLLVGYSADIDVILESHDDVLRLPSEAVIDNKRVYRFNPDTGTIAAVEVGIGLSNWDFTEITSGLQQGDQVVVSLDVEGLADGATATVAQ